MKVKGKWVYLYRAVDKAGNTIDFYLSRTRNAKAAKRFLGKSLKSIPNYSQPSSINTDKNPAYGKAIKELKANGQCQVDLEHRQVRYLNNIIESDHGKLKRLIKLVIRIKFVKRFYLRIIPGTQKKIKKVVDKWGELGVAVFIGVPLQTSILCILGELAEGRFLTLVVGLRGDLLDTIL